MLEDIEPESEDTDSEESYPEEDSLDPSYVPPEEDKISSPPRKKQRTATTTSEISQKNILDLNEQLKSNPTAWLERCQYWAQDLATMSLVTNSSKVKRA